MNMLLTLLLFLQFPMQKGYLNDYAGLLTAEQQGALEQKLTSIDVEYAIQCNVAIVASLEGEDKKNYATRLGNYWAIGQQQKSQGILILIAQQEKEIFIATGLGLTKPIDPSFTQQIIDELVIPLLKDGAYYAAVDNAIDGVTGKWEYYQPKEETHWGWTAGVILMGVVIVVIIIDALRFPSAKKERRRRAGLMRDQWDKNDTWGKGQF